MTGKKLRKARKKRTAVLAAACLLTGLMVWNTLQPGTVQAHILRLPVRPRISAESAGTVSNLGLNSSCALLLRKSDGQVLMEKNGSRKMYPASMTKIMTVLVALQRLPNRSQRVTLTQDIFVQMQREDASLAGYHAGQSVRVQDLLYGALLPSGGECCLGLAKAAAGSEEKFVGLMNQQAQKLGMHHTHFADSTGLYRPQHYSTARDFALLLDCALDNADFRTLFTTHTYKTGSLTFTSTLFNGRCPTALPSGTILGGKTGFTDEAGYCLASLACVRGQEYLLVTAKAPRYGGHVQDAVKVYSRI